MRYTSKEKGRSYHTATLKNRQSHPNKSRSKSQSNFDRSTLMMPSSALEMMGIRYRQVGARLSVQCPFHADGKERNPSLAMDAKDGHYRCFSCGEKGGDVIAFYRAVTGSGFVEALKLLGAHHG